MMISDADFDELFFDDDAAQLYKDGASATDRTLSNRDAGQPVPDPFQAAATLAMTSPFEAAMAMMSAFGAQPRI